MSRKPNAMPNGGGGGGWKAMNEQMAANREKRMAEMSLHGTDLFGAPVEKKHTSKLGDEFLIPPFSVLSAREGWWQERKRAWLSMGIQSELGRGDTAVNSPHEGKGMADGLVAIRAKQKAARTNAAPGGVSDASNQLQQEPSARQR